MSFAGLILKDNLEEECKISFLTDNNLSCFSVSTNKEIVELIEEHEPEIISVNVGIDETPEEFTEQEQNLIDEGFSFIPNSQKKKLMKRLESLTSHLNKTMGVKSPEVIRFDPIITAKELAISNDSDLRGLGINTEDIISAEMFDAALGSVTARFYEQNQYEDFEVIVPSPLEE